MLGSGIKKGKDNYTEEKHHPGRQHDSCAATATAGKLEATLDVRHFGPQKIFKKLLETKS